MSGTLNLDTDSRLSGAGVLEGNLVNSGVVTPGNTQSAIGTLTIDGDYTQSGGELALGVGGLGAEGGFDLLHVLGTAVFDGDLRLTAPYGNAPIVGQTYRVIPFAAHDGQFDLIHGATAVGAAKFIARYEADGFYLDAVTDNGPRVLSAEPAGVVDVAITQFLVRFDEPISRNSLLENATLVGPRGVYSPSGVGAYPDNVYRISFDAQIAPGEYTLTIGPQVTDTTGDAMDQDADGAGGEEEQNQDTFTGRVTLSAVEQAVLLVSTFGTSSYKANSLHDALLAAGARAKWVNLNEEGQVAEQLSQEDFDQVWILDLSENEDAYATDWQAIADWYAEATTPGIITDARIESITSSETENYYYHLKAVGGGLVLGTGSERYQTGINSLNSAIQVDPFSGTIEDVWYTTVDEGNPLTTAPNDLGGQFFTWGTLGQVPIGAQANGRTLYAVAWSDGELTQPAVAWTQPGSEGFQVHITSPLNDDYYVELDRIVFRAQFAEGVEPVTYSWTSDIDGHLGVGQLLEISTLTPGEQHITVQAQDAGGANALDEITVMIEILPGYIDVDLQAASDTGTSATDNVTRATTPVFDMVVNQAGRIEVDFDGDGSIDATRTVASPGAYPFTAPTFLDGVHTVSADFFPDTGAPSRNTLTVNIDTQSPRQLTGRPTEQAPSYRRVIRFSEAVEWSAELATQMELTGPGGEQIPLTNVIVQDLEVRIDFAALIEPGSYFVSAPALIRDLAGNPLDQDGDGNAGEADDDHLLDVFTLLLDVTSPFVTSVVPVGSVNSDLTTFTIAFNEEMQVDRFSVEDVTLTGPDGIVDREALSLSHSSTKQFSINVAPQVKEGEYQLTFGPDIPDLTGNTLTEAYSTSVTLDKTGPRIVAVTPTGTVSGHVSQIDVTFDTYVSRYDFPTNAVRIVGPDGPVNVSYVGWGSGTTLPVYFAQQSTNGEYLVTIGPGVTDAVGNRMDQDGDGINGEAFDPGDGDGDDVFESSFMIAMPDLEATSISADSDAVFGRDLTVSWIVGNTGSTTTEQSWVERVWLIPEGNGDDLLLIEQSYGDEDPLNADTARARHATISLPYIESLVSGEYRLFVEIDVAGAITETDETNNSLLGEILAIESPPPPDLQIVALTVDDNSPVSGDTVEVTWVVKNLGTSATPIAHWGDDVYLSADATLDPETDYFVGRFSHSGSLEVDEPYAVNRQINVPLSYDGTYYVLVKTDAGDQVREREYENNNVAGLQIEVQIKPAPDLEVVSVNAPDFGQPGATISISWTVTNDGQLPEWTPWYDRIYISPTTEITKDSRQLAARVRSEGLDVDGRYTKTVDVTLPSLPDGNYQILVATDADRQIFERNREDNNLGVALQSLRLRHPDLVSTVTVAPESVVSGEEMSVTWRTENRGSAPTLGGWTDRVYLSRDVHLSGKDLLVSSHAFEEPMAAGEGSSATATFSVPIEYSGQFFILIVSDADQQVLEVLGEANNQIAQPLEIELAPYANLVVSDVVAPAQTIADPATVTVSWTVRNLGTGAVSPTIGATW